MAASGSHPPPITQSESRLIREQTLAYYRDIQDHIIQALDTIEAFGDTASGMLDIYLSSLSHHLNEVMKVLTIIATIFMPLTFIAGIYGMNLILKAHDLICLSLIGHLAICLYYF